MPAFYATTAGTTWCQPLCVLLFLGTALLFLCTGAAGICPCRALSPHLHGKRFCTRCGIVTLGECPKKEHSFTYFPHQCGAFCLSSSKYWDFWEALRPKMLPTPRSRRRFRQAFQCEAQQWTLHARIRAAPGPSARLRFIYTPLPNVYPVFIPCSVTCRCPDWSLRLPGAHPSPRRPVVRRERRSRGGKTWMPSISPSSPSWRG